MLKNQGDNGLYKNFPTNPPLLTGIGKHTEQRTNFNFRLSYQFCGGSDCAQSDEFKTTTTPAPFTETPDSRPESAIFSSNNPFGFAMYIPEFGYYRTINALASSFIRKGENLYIKPGIWLVIDQELPELGNVVVEGVLEFGSELESIKMKNLIVLGGQVLLTPYKNSFRCSPLKITFTAQAEGDDFTFGYENHFGTKGIACFGTCNFLAKSVDQPIAILDQNVEPGQNLVAIGDNNISDWPIESEILLTSTSMNSRQTEYLSILEVEDSTLKLTSPVKNFHRGVARPSSLTSLKGEVAHLTRRVILKGLENDQGFGMKILVGTATIPNHLGLKPDVIKQYRGVLRMDGIEIKNSGQFGLEFKDKTRMVFSLD